MDFPDLAAKKSRAVLPEDTARAEYAARFIDLIEYPLNFSAIPAHIAIVMDGNGRWAKKRGLPRAIGHRSGVNAVDKVVEACTALGVQCLSLYAFSTENWKRPQEEVGILMQLLIEFAQSKLQKICANNVRIAVSGDLAGVPAAAALALRDLIARTQENSGLVLNLCINYGGRRELVRAAGALAAMAKSGEIEPSAIDEELFAKQLYTNGLPEPELMIRTSGEMRLSNFLLWQLAYAEFYFTQCYWPDFLERELLIAISDFQSRKRRFGGLDTK